MSLENSRRQVRALLHERSVADASAAYYALYHPDDRTELRTLTDSNGVVQGYACLSRTGMDLFRPLLTMRLPTSGESGQVDPRRTTELLYSAVSPGTALILSAPQAYRPYISALFEIQSEVQLTLMELDRDRYEPIINVLVTESESYNNLPRFVLRAAAGSGANTSQEVAASAGINWQSPYFADIYVHTKPAFRRRGFGRSVVAAVVQRVLNHDRTPLYSVAVDNQASFQLAESVGFADTGLIDILYEATLKQNPT